MQGRVSGQQGLGGGTAVVVAVVVVALVVSVQMVLTNRALSQGSCSGAWRELVSTNEPGGRIP